MADEQEEILETNDVNMDFRRMRQTHEVAGYREGVESGKDAHLQEGFNQGFAYGASVSGEWGKLRGALSALMSLVTPKLVQDSNSNIQTEIMELLTQVTQMERNGLHIQTMQHTMETRKNQTSRHLETCEARNGPNSYQRASGRNSTREEQVDGNELTSAFEMLHTRDTVNGVGDDELNGMGDLHVDSETVVERKETSRGDFLDTAVHDVPDECSGSLELPKTVIDDLEIVWFRTICLAEKLGLGRQKILLVKTTCHD